MKKYLVATIVTAVASMSLMAERADIDTTALKAKVQELKKATMQERRQIMNEFKSSISELSQSDREALMLEFKAIAKQEGIGQTIRTQAQTQTQTQTQTQEQMQERRQEMQKSDAMEHVEGMMTRSQIREQTEVNHELRQQRRERFMENHPEFRGTFPMNSDTKTYTH